MKTTLFLLFFILLSDLYAEDIVLLKNGSTLMGKIVSIDNENVIIERDGTNLSLNSSIIESYSFGNVSNSFEFPTLGITIGSPGGINITSSYYSTYLSTRVSFGYVPESVAGAQLLVGYPIIGNRNAVISPSFVFGTSEFERSYSNDWTYIGLGVDVHIFGFTSFVGFGKDLEYINQKYFIFDIGYKYAWN